MNTNTAQHILWQHLFAIQSLTFSAAESSLKTTGVGTVQVNACMETGVMDFSETVLRDGKHRGFDAKRWLFDEMGVVFCRLRHGKYEPIFRFVWTGAAWEMAQEYWCGQDCYRGELVCDDDAVRLRVQIAGKNKVQDVWYVYR